MPIRKLLLPLTGTAATTAPPGAAVAPPGSTSAAALSAAALGTAALIARRWDAHIAALHVRVDSRDLAPLAGEGLSGAMIQDMMNATERESGARLAAVRAQFDEVMQAEQIPVHAGADPDAADPDAADPDAAARGPSARLITITGREDDLVAQQARLADLAVVPHPNADEDVSSSDALHAVLFDSGRPVLIAPRQRPATVGTRICIGWNGSAESAAAVQAVLPWLQRAEAVQVLAAAEYQRRGPAAPELLAYLALHGVRAHTRIFRPVDRDVGAGMLEAAMEFGADLLSMGAYSHSRLRQLILGGVTRHVLEHAALTVMMNR